MEKSHKTSQLDEIDVRILNLSFENPSMTDQEIGSSIGLCRESVTRRKQREAYRKAISEVKESVTKRLRAVSKKAVSELENLLMDQDPKIRLAAVAITLKFMPQPSLSESFDDI